MTIRLREVEWVYVNLASRPDRREYVEQECARVGIQAKRFDALRTEDYRGSPESIGPQMNRDGPVAGRIGCFLSHLTLINGARNTLGILGILEDDVLFCDDFAERFQYIEEHFDKPWDMFFLGSTYHADPGGRWHKELGRDFEQTDIKYIHRIYGTWNTYAYLINRESAGKIADLMYEHSHRCTAVDHLFILIEPLLNCYCFTPGMAFQQDGKSDVDEGVTLFSGFLQMGGYVFARRLADFDYDSYFSNGEGKQQ